MSKENRKKVEILTGPTGSGKSALAMAWAKEKNGVILNADAMQMYRELCILTARPTEEEEAVVPHRLYGVWSGAEAGNVARWMEAAIPEIRACWEEGRLPILVGGTGMYLKMLMEGISPVPEIEATIRAEVREIAQEDLHPRLSALDPVMAQRLKPGDTQRLQRALEVMLSTGRSLAAWQEEKDPSPLPEAEFTLHVHTLPRPELYARIDTRVLKMVDAGAIEEVKRLRELSLPEGSPLLQAVGVPEFSDFVDGKITIEQAITLTQQHSRNYAKRQLTWMRNQFGEAVS